jgi:hypothetical protein
MASRNAHAWRDVNNTATALPELRRQAVIRDQLRSQFLSYGNTGECRGETG